MPKQSDKIIKTVDGRSKLKKRAEKVKDEEVKEVVEEQPKEVKPKKEKKPRQSIEIKPELDAEGNPIKRGKGRPKGTLKPPELKKPRKKRVLSDEQKVEQRKKQKVYNDNFRSQDKEYECKECSKRINYYAKSLHKKSALHKLNVELYNLKNKVNEPKEVEV